MNVWDATVRTELAMLGPKLDSLFAEIRGRIAPGGRVLALGYPRFIPDPPHGDCDFLPGFPTGEFSRAEQAWINARLKFETLGVNYEIAAAVRRAQRATPWDRVRFQYVDVEDSFDGDELCVSAGGEPVPESIYMNGLYLAFPVWSFHPNAHGHTKLAEDVLSAYYSGGPGTTTTVAAGETVVSPQSVSSALSEVVFATTWVGSDVQLSLTTPSGLVINRQTQDPNIVHSLGPFFESYAIANPEPGLWTVELFGADVPEGSEQVRLHVVEFPAENEHPTAAIEANPTTGPTPLTVDFDASNSNDPDGTIAHYQWYFGDGTVGTGQRATHTYTTPGPYRAVLAVSDDRGATSFAEVAVTAWMPIDVKPGSTRNPVKPSAHGVLPVAILGSPAFDVTEIVPDSLRAEDTLASPAHDLTDPAVYAEHLEDINEDGWIDLVAHFMIRDLQLTADSTELCVGGELVTGAPVYGCDSIHVLS